jgi:ABC-type dipeptide/oligopeptide/nickel transport system permease subunit
MTSDPRSIAVPASGVGATQEGAGTVEGTGVEARGQWEQAWRRFRRDRVAVASGIAIIVIILVSFIGAPIAAHMLGHGPNDINTNAVVNYAPVGPMSRVANADGAGSTLYVMGAADTIGRDELLRILYGAQVSLEVAIIATCIGLMVGLVLGTLAGFYGGVLDTIVSRMTEIVMAFPLLLFAIALAATIGDRLNSSRWGSSRPACSAL